MNNTQEEQTVNGNGEQIAEFAIVRGATSGNVKVTSTGITIAEDTTWEQWREGLKLLKWAKTKLAIGVSDYIAFGARKWGQEKVNQALEQLEFELTTVKTAMAIGSVPMELRHSNLESDHYVELARADIPPAGKIKWARIASEQHLTPSQLRFSMVEGEVVDKAATRELQHGVVTIHGIRQSFDVWNKKVNGLEGIKKMDRHHQEDIFTELEAIASFANQLEEHLEEVLAT